MVVYRTTNGFAARSEGDFIKLLNDICEKMTGNPNFPDRQASTKDLVSERDKYVKLSALATNGGNEAILARDVLRQTVVNHLHILGSQITADSKNNVMVLKSSGFPVVKERQASPPLEKPVSPKVSPGINLGQIKCSAKKQNRTDSVTYWIGTDPADRSTWKSYTRTVSKFVFDNLVSGQRYWIQYELSGVRDQQVMSDMVSYIAQ